MSYEFIEKAAPEEVGISSLWIEAFLKRLRDIGYDIHSFQIIRNGKLVFAKAAEPYALTDGHRLLSAAKPIIALAVLFAIDEGKLSFDDKVVDYFQDMVPEDVDERMQKMPLYDLKIDIHGSILPCLIQGRYFSIHFVYIESFLFFFHYAQICTKNNRKSMQDSRCYIMLSSIIL